MMMLENGPRPIHDTSRPHGSGGRGDMGAELKASEMRYRRLFETAFVDGRTSGRSTLATIGTGRSIACSTPEALAWNPAWECLAGDISGRAIAGVHSGDAALEAVV